MPPEPLHVVNDKKYAQWARWAGQIPLDDHVRLVRRFTTDLMDSGWRLEDATLRPLSIPPPHVRNGRGTQLLPGGKFHLLAQHPARGLDVDSDFAVVWPDLAEATRAASQLSSALDRLFHGDGLNSPRVRKLRRMSADAMNLVLIRDSDDLSNMPAFRDELRAAEAAGIRFKLAKLGSLSSPYPALNIAYDMFVIAGGKPWIPADDQPAFCCMDAGHDKVSGKSRWVKVETDEQQVINTVRVIDTGLAEHMPFGLAQLRQPRQM
jgi:hypothetical protein